MTRSTLSAEQERQAKALEQALTTPVRQLDEMSEVDRVILFGSYATVRLDVDNEVQPDAFLRLETAVGGRSRISEDDYVEGPPELIVEVAGSSAAIDLHTKLNVYRRNGVPEYLVWQVYDGRVDWFELREERYVAVSLDDRGVFHSGVFPGLRLATKALLDGDLAGVLAELQKGIGTPEHQTFVNRLADSLKGKA